MCTSSEERQLSKLQESCVLLSPRKTSRPTTISTATVPFAVQCSLKTFRAVLPDGRRGSRRGTCLFAFTPQIAIQADRASQPKVRMIPILTAGRTFRPTICAYALATAAHRTVTRRNGLGLVRTTLQHEQIQNLKSVPDCMRTVQRVEL